MCDSIDAAEGRITTAKPIVDCVGNALAIGDTVRIGLDTLAQVVGFDRFHGDVRVAFLPQPLLWSEWRRWEFAYMQYPAECLELLDCDQVNAGRQGITR